MFNQFLYVSNGMKLVCFFRIISLLGGIKIFIRALIFVATISSIFYFLA